MDDKENKFELLTSKGDCKSGLTFQQLNQFIQNKGTFDQGNAKSKKCKNWMRLIFQIAQEKLPEVWRRKHRSRLRRILPSSKQISYKVNKMAAFDQKFWMLKKASGPEDVCTTVIP